MRISESGREGGFDHRVWLTSSLWLLWAGMDVALLGLPCPCRDPELWVMSVLLLLPCPPALGEKAHREITAVLTRSKCYADFSAGNLPGVQQEV